MGTRNRLPTRLVNILSPFLCVRPIYMTSNINSLMRFRIRTVLIVIEVVLVVVVVVVVILVAKWMASIYEKSSILYGFFYTPCQLLLLLLQSLMCIHLVRPI